MSAQTERQTGAQTEVRSVRAHWKRIPFIIPLIMVNVAALVGQSIWTYHQLREHFLTNERGIAIASAVLMGLAMESIGVYLSIRAHEATMADQSSGGLRLSSYGVGVTMAVINFRHFSNPPVESMELGLMFGIASLVSPWLWSVDSKAAHRAQLAARGVVDPRGVKLSTVRKAYHPLRSFRVARWASWAGVVDPVAAVEGWESARRSTRTGTQTPLVKAHVEVSSPPTEPVRESARESMESVPVPAIESAPESPQTEAEGESVDSQDESVTETVTETVTRTRTQTRTRVEARMQTLAERVESVKSHPDYINARADQSELTYDQIGAIIGKRGREVIKPVYLVLYRNESVESMILGSDA